MRSTLPKFPRPRERRQRRTSSETALTSDGTLLLIIATTIVLACAWVGWHYYESDEDEARAYAGRTIERLAITHDLHYLTTNLSSAAMPGYPTSRRQLIISSLTKLGVPTGPINPVASTLRDKDPGIPGPIMRFTTHLAYPAADARLFLEVARWHGSWRIELLALEWKDTALPGPTASP